MNKKIGMIAASLLFTLQLGYANPYWDKSKVPSDSSYRRAVIHYISADELKTVTNNDGINVLRLQVNFNENTESYTLAKSVIESSGTAALLSRSQHEPKLGSYIGVLKEDDGRAVAYDSIGTGKEYRKLARAINLRFPLPKHDLFFELYAENPSTGQMERVLTQIITVAGLAKEAVDDSVEVKELSLATQSPVIRVNIYADGYLASERQTFWQHAQKTVHALQSEKFPGVEHMSFYGVYHASNKKLGSPSDLGRPIPEYDSFLGLYYPYWEKFGRWYDVVYPTREDKFRRGLAAAPYDYPIVLMNSDGYWGVGNYMSHTAIPAANNYYFTYLLLHEFGHFFGLNEEYEGGGRTELEFAPGMVEPWSQNITFFGNEHYENLKWNRYVSRSTPLPTPYSVWQSLPPIYGAYEGGYADSPVNNGRSYKPGLNCVMESHKHFCDICTKAILDVINVSGS